MKKNPEILLLEEQNISGNILGARLNGNKAHKGIEGKVWCEDILL